MKTCDLTLLNVTTLDGRRADISFSGGHTVHVGSAIKAENESECHGMLLLPAATDMHVHMRGGVQANKEDWRTGTMSAIAGGVTCVVDQPNTIPPLVSGTRIRERVQEALNGAVCRFAINGGVTPQSDMAALRHAGAMAYGEIFAGPSSYGEAVPAARLSEAFRSISEFDGLATIHAEDVGASRPENLEEHSLNRSPAMESGAVHKVCEINNAGCRLHFCHLSTGLAIGSACKERARVPHPCSGYRGDLSLPGISVEVAPHHLLLSFEEFNPGDTHAKVNPPLRSKKDRLTVWDRWDMIDVIASDHAPHTSGEKELVFSEAPSGIPGVETMVPLLIAELMKRHIPLTSLVEKTSLNPCRILGIPGSGLNPGERADFALYGKEPAPVCPDDLHSRAGWTPFEGHPAIFPTLVVMNGNIVYNRGEFFPLTPVWYPGAGYCQDHDLNGMG